MAARGPANVRPDSTDGMRRISGGDDFRYGLLGPLLVRRSGDPVAVNAGKHRALLAALLVDANRAVPVEVLVDRVWGDDPPANTQGALQSHVTRLRRLLGGAPGPITTQPDGYAITVADDAIDVDRFAAAVREAYEIRDSGDLETAAAKLKSALALWRGDPFADIPSDVLAREVVPGLVEQRLLATESRIALDIALGRHRDLVAELRDLTNRYPLRERFWAQLMRVLYENGRQAEALDCYRIVSERLADELGIDPGPELRAAHQATLTGEFDEPAPRVRVADDRAPRNDLPGDVPDFTGRDDELRELAGVVPPSGTAWDVPAVVAINGMAGVGKTALALHAAHRLAAQYPDGQLFVDLHGHDPSRAPLEPAAALDTLLRALRPAGARLPESLDERAALWRADLADKRIVLVLDNAATAAQVRPLLPGRSGSLVLITSRRRLTDLDASHTVPLGLLPHQDAYALLARVIGPARAGAEPDAVNEVITCCGHLPLAIRIAAARLHSRPAWTVGYLVARLRDEQRRLTELATGERSVTAAFELSYRQLTPEQQRLFRALGLPPGRHVDTYLAAAIIGTDPDQAEDLLEHLVDLNLLDQPTAGIYRFHDLLRQHARATAERTDPEPDRRDALTRAFDYHLAATVEANRHLERGGFGLDPELEHPPAYLPDMATNALAMRWLDDECDNLVAATMYAAEHGWPAHAWQLPYTLWRYFELRGRYEDWIATHHRALAAVGDKADEALAAVNRTLGTVYWHTGEYDRALAHYQHAMDAYGRLGNRKGEAVTVSNIGNIHFKLGRLRLAFDHYERGLRMEGPDGINLSNIGMLCMRMGRYAEAVDYHTQALAHSRAAGDLRHEANTLDNLGEVYQRLDRRTDAMDHYERARTLFAEVGDRSGEGRALNHVGMIHCRQGRYEQALDCQERALAMLSGVGTPNTVSQIHNGIGETLSAMGRKDDARPHHESALVMAIDTANLYLQAQSHQLLGNTHVDTDPDVARDHHQRGLAIFTRLDVPEAAALRAALGNLTGH